MATSPNPVARLPIAPRAPDRLAGAHRPEGEAEVPSRHAADVLPPELWGRVAELVPRAEQTTLGALRNTSQMLRSVVDGHRPETRRELLNAAVFRHINGRAPQLSDGLAAALASTTTLRLPSFSGPRRGPQDTRASALAEVVRAAPQLQHLQVGRPLEHDALVALTPALAASHALRAVHLEAIIRTAGEVTQIGEAAGTRRVWHGMELLRSCVDERALADVEAFGQALASLPQLQHLHLDLHVARSASDGIAPRVRRLIPHIGAITIAPVLAGVGAVAVLGAIVAAAMPPEPEPDPFGRTGANVLLYRALVAPLQRCPALRRVTLPRGGLEKLSAVYLACMVGASPNLEALSLPHLFDVHAIERAAQAIIMCTALSQTAQLRALHLQAGHVVDISEELWRQVIARHAGLRVLSLHTSPDAPDLPGGVLSAAAHGATKRLQLQAWAHVLGEARSLEVLELFAPQGERAAVSAWARPSDPAALAGQVAGMAQLGDSIASLPRLQRVVLGAIDVPRAACVAYGALVRGCRGVRELELVLPRTMPLALSDAVGAALAECRALRRLRLSAQDVAPAPPMPHVEPAELVPQLRQLDDLEHLELCLAVAQGRAEALMEALAAMPSLRTVYLSALEGWDPQTRARAAQALTARGIKLCATLPARPSEVSLGEAWDDEDGRSTEMPHRVAAHGR